MTLTGKGRTVREAINLAKTRPHSTPTNPPKGPGENISIPHRSICSPVKIFLLKTYVPGLALLRRTMLDNVIFGIEAYVSSKNCDCQWTKIFHFLRSIHCIFYYFTFSLQLSDMEAGRFWSKEEISSPDLCVSSNTQNALLSTNTPYAHRYDREIVYVVGLGN